MPHNPTPQRAEVADFRRDQGNQVTGPDSGVGVSSESPRRGVGTMPGGTIMRPDHVKAASRRLLSTEEVAEALCVTTKTVRRWIARGELPAVKLHRQWRVRVTDLDVLLVGDRDAA